MPDTTVELDVLERRVGEKWAAAAAGRMNAHAFNEMIWARDFPDFDMHDGDVQPLPADWPQFPRQQWASYPNKRRLALLACEAVLERDDDLTDEQWTLVCFIMQYGGKTRIA